MLDLLSEVLTLITFTAMLWELSGSIILPIFGGITIPGYMMWVALLYSAVGSWLTYKIGRPLVRVNFELQRYNADFRYRMMRVRENAEAIALYQRRAGRGKPARRAFGRIYAELVGIHALQQAADLVHRVLRPGGERLPDRRRRAALLSPASFPWGPDADGNAFGRVQGALSWFVDTYSRDPRRLEGGRRPADHLRRSDGAAKERQPGRRIRIAPAVGRAR